MPDQSAPTAYAPTDRTVPTRSRERASYDRALVHAILDETYVCHLGFVRDGAPVVLPTLYARVGEVLYLHGSTGSRPLRMAAGHTGGTTAEEPEEPEKSEEPVEPAAESGNGAAPGAQVQGADDGLPVCVTVTHVDGLVLARSAFHHSINYRSVVVHGLARPVTDPDEKRTALDALVDHVVPGRAADSRRANTKELAATAVLRLDLAEVSAKMRTGDPGDEPEDLDLPHWAGVVPLQRGYGPPIPSADLTGPIPVPDYVRAL